jgi:hypothetical protein
MVSGGMTEFLCGVCVIEQINSLPKNTFSTCVKCRVLIPKFSNRYFGEKLKIECLFFTLIPNQSIEIIPCIILVVFAIAPKWAQIVGIVQLFKAILLLFM